MSGFDATGGHQRPPGPVDDGHDPELHAMRAASFGTSAAAYAEHRPDYPPAAIRWALEAMRTTDSGGAGPVPRVLDLAAGTGKLAAQLASPDLIGRQVAVAAVEPDPRMRAELRRRAPGLPVLAGTAEAIPLAAATIDAVFVGQAAHWFDLDRAMPELARVLRPGGLLAGLWNGHDDRIGWVAGLYSVVGHRSEVAYSSWAQGGQDSISRWLGPTGRPPFGPPTCAGFGHAQLRTAGSLIETLRTHSNYLVGDPEMTDAKLATIRLYLGAQPETAIGQFALPLYTHAVRVVRRA